MSGHAGPVVVMSERLGPIGEHERRLEVNGAQLRCAPLWSSRDFLDHAADAAVIMVGAVEPVDATVLSGLPQCVAIVRRGVGHDNVDVAIATRLGIVVANVPDASVDEVAEHALALLLALERRVVRLDKAVHAGVWQEDPRGIIAARQGMRRIAELTLGVVGFGRIGRALVRRARALYRAVLVTDPAVDSDDIRSAGAEPVTLPELCARADHVSLHAALGKSSRNIIDAQTIAQMRRGAILVNTARGGLIDEAALIDAVRAGHLGGAGLDVTASEPLPVDHPLLGVDGIVLTAHSAAFSTTSASELRRRAVAAVADLLAGRTPESVVNPEVLSSSALRLPRVLGGGTRPQEGAIVDG